MAASLLTVALAAAGGDACAQGVDTIDLTNRTSRCASATTYALDVYGAWHGPTPAVFVAPAAAHHFDVTWSAGGAAAVSVRIVVQTFPTAFCRDVPTARTYEFVTHRASERLDVVDGPDDVRIVPG